MTRETKVGLLIGMAIILFIGIIISDQLSSGAKDDGPTLTTFAPQAQPNITPVPTPVHSDPTWTGGQSPVLRPEDVQAGGAAQHQANVGNATSLGAASDLGQRAQYQQGDRSPLLTPHDTRPSQAAQPEAGNPQSPNEPLIAARPDPSRPVALADAAARAQGGAQLDPALAIAERIMREQGRDMSDPAVQKALTDWARYVAQQNRQGQPATAQRTETPQPAERQPVVHYVKANESLWQIAERYYGSGAHWKLIAQANREQVNQSDGGVREGARLVIPNRAGMTQGTSATAHGAPSAQANLSDTRQARTETRTNATPTTTANANTPAANANGAATVVAATHVVKDGDTLWSIAEAQLGSGLHHDRILALNRELLRGDARNLQVGMKLAIPKREESR